MDSPPVPLLAFSAYSGSGKTTLLERVVPELRKIGLRIAIIKHTHHRVDLDQPGKDSYRLREAGANPVMIASKKRWALLFESGPDQDEPQLSALVAQLDPAMFDLVLVEGFKEQPVAKIEIIRQGVEKSALHPKDSSFIAVASDLPDLESSLPVLDLNNPTAIANFISAWMREYPMSQTDRKKAPVSSQVEAHNRALLPVAAALQQIRAAITPIRGRILCHLKEAYGHIVAGDIGSPIAVPGYDNSAMDGYAFHADDLPGAAPKTLRLVGSSLAGAPFAGSIKPGEAIRITTGAATPDG